MIVTERRAAVKKSNWKSGALRLLFAAYGALMLWLLFIRGRQAAPGDYWEQVQQNLNLVPFRTIGLFWYLLTRRQDLGLVRESIVNLGGNVIMFIPLGFFLPALFPKLGKLWRTLLAAALTVIAVETAQLFLLVGSCDIDDLLLNLLGAAIGFFLCRPGKN